MLTQLDSKSTLVSRMPKLVRLSATDIEPLLESVKHRSLAAK